MSVASVPGGSRGQFDGVAGTAVGPGPLVDVIPHIVWVAAPDGSLAGVNAWGARYTGRAGDVTGTWYADPAIHPDDAGALRAAWDRAVQEERPLRLTLRVRRADGEYRWHRLHGLPLRNEAGQIVQWVGTATDIEEVRSGEPSSGMGQRQADALDLLEKVHGTAPVGFGFVDRDFRLVRVNDTLAAIAGIDAEESIGKPLGELVPGAGPHVESMFAHVLDTGEAILNRPVSSGGMGSQERTHSWLVNYYPVPADGEILGVGVIVVDITDRAEAEEFRSVVMAHMEEGLYTVDNDGLLTSMNRAASTMLGYEEAELLGRSMHQQVHFQRADGTPITPEECPLSAVWSTGAAVREADETFTRKDGSILLVTYSAAPLYRGPTICGVVIVFRDSTGLRERRTQEVTDRHDQKLESLGRLSAGIAHEINTPIQFVGDNTRFLASAYQDMLELLLVYRSCLDATSGGVPWQERARRVTEAEDKADIDYLAAEVPVAVEQSLEGIERVASLVRAMKAFSYKDSQNHSYADLNAALTTTLTVARNEVKYVADVVLDLGELPEVLCCVGDLNQVFLNLLVNAADALHDKGERGEIRIATRVDGAMVVISIADNGPGIPENIQKVIFEPFFTTKEVGKGTGQGLALARAVTDKHGGQIEVHSTAGTGTEFVMRLPVDGKRSGSA